MIDAVKAPNSILKVMVATQQYQAKPDSLSNHAVNLINCLVEAPEINMKKLKYLVFNGGIPDDVNGLRPIIWRIMLGMWPADTSQWVDILRSQRETYTAYTEELITKPSLQKPPEQDHPLSTSNTSQWKQYYDDQKIWETIEKDVKRTRCELGFFYSALDPNRNSKEDLERLEKQHRTKKAELTQE